MNICTVTRVVMCAALVTGCVSSGTHEETVAQLEEARKGAAQSAAAFEGYKKQAAAEADSLKNQLADVNARIAALMSGTTTAQDEIARLQKRAGELEAETARANDLVKQLSERDQNLSERLKSEAAEKARLEKERAAKEAEIQRLTRTHEELTKSLQAEIAKGDIKIKQVRDRLTINMVDRASLSAVGYADTRPLAGNDTEEGRTANRRIEIALYPKDLSEIASQLTP